MPDPILPQEGAAPAPAPAAAAPAPVAAAADEATLLGQGEGKAAKEIEKLAEKTKEEVPADKKEETAEEKSAREAKEGQPAKEAVPEKYDFKVPEGMALDSSLLEKVTPIFKELGITQTGAQKLVDAYAPYVKAQAEASVKAQQEAAMKGFESVKAEWKDQTNKLLGAEPAKELSHAAKFINKFGTPELRQMLNDTGVGNHPELVKIFIAAGKAISEDAMPKGKSSN